MEKKSGTRIFLLIILALRAVAQILGFTGMLMLPELTGENQALTALLALMPIGYIAAFIGTCKKLKWTFPVIATVMATDLIIVLVFRGSSAAAIGALIMDALILYFAHQEHKALK